MLILRLTFSFVPPLMISASYATSILPEALMPFRVVGMTASLPDDVPNILRAITGVLFI